VYLRITVSYRQTRRFSQANAASIAFAQERPGGHGVGNSNIELLRLFLSKLPRLKAIIVHGAVANQEMDRIELPAWLHRVSTPHFSRGVSYNKIDDIAAQIAKLAAG
jgi:hypothetical protein